MTLTTGLADVHVLMVDVAHLADGSNAVQGNVAHLTGRQTHQSVTILLSHQLSLVAGGANQLAALTGVQLHVVDDGTDGDVGERQSVAGLDVGVGAGHHGVAHLQALGSQDVALHAVLILDQGDVSAAVGIVLQGQDLGGNVELVPLEVDDAVLGAVAAAMMTNGDAAGVVAASALLHRLKQAALGRDLAQHAVIGNSHAAAARSSRLILFDSHC